MAIANGFDYVVCGHIHQPEIKEIQNKDGGKVQYLNSGDWVENSTSLEYYEGKWVLHYEQQSKASSNKNAIHDTRKEAMSFDVLLAEITQNFVKV